jgi:putative peptidoglycan lipid II flippase
MTHQQNSNHPTDNNSTTVQKNDTRKGDRIVGQALSMAFGTMSSRVLGLLRETLFMALFPKTVTDAWVVAFRLPNMFRRLLGEGSLSVSFIPVFIDAKNADPSGVRVRNLLNGFYAFMLVVLGVVTTLGIVFAPELCDLMGAGYFKEVSGKYELTVQMARIMFGFIFLMSTYAYFMGILNALGRFGLPAIAPTFFNIAMIGSNFWPQNLQSYQGQALAWGVIAGGFLQTGMMVPALIKAGYFPKPNWTGFTADIQRVLKSMLPGMVGVGLLQIMTFMNSSFAASQGEASNTLINAADRVLELPLSLVSVSIGTALLPTLAQYWNQQEKEKMLETASFYLRVNLMMAIPAAAGLYLLAHPIIELLFGYGKFTAQDVQIAAGILEIYSLTLVFSSSVRVLAPSYYAIKNTWYPALVSVICLVIHFFLAPFLMKTMALEGMVLSTSLTAGLNLLALLAAQRFFMGSFNQLVFLKSIGKIVLASLGIAVGCQIYLPLRSFVEGFLMAPTGEGGLQLMTIPLLVLSRILPLGLTIAAAAILFLILMNVFKGEELEFVQGKIFRKISRRFKKT